MKQFLIIFVAFVLLGAGGGCQPGSGTSGSAKKGSEEVSANPNFNDAIKDDPNIPNNAKEAILRGNRTPSSASSSR